MKRVLVLFFCLCALYTGFWLLRAHHLKKFIAQKIREKGSFKYSQIHCSGFPFSIDVHLINPKLGAVFELEGDLTLATSLFARKGSFKASGSGKASLLGKEIEFSGIIGCKHHNLWQLIRNNSLFSEPTSKNLAKLLPKLTFFADSITLKYKEQSFSADHVFAKNQFDQEGSSLQFNIKGAQSSLAFLQRYYFNEKCDLRGNLSLKNQVEIQYLTIEDRYFRHQFSGVIKNWNGTEGDLTFEFSQAVKKEYHPDLQKEHLSRIAREVSFAFPERRLFGLICGNGDLHFANGSLELQKCHWKFGRYEMELAGQINKNKSHLDVHFHYYPELKLFIAKKLKSASELFAIVETQGSIDERTGTLSLQLQFEDSKGLCIGDLPISL